MNEITRFIIFGVVSALRTVAELVFWRLLVSVCERKPNFVKKLHVYKLNQFSFSHILSFVASVTASFYLNRYLVFSDTLKNSSNFLILNFVVVSLFTLLISTISINLLTENSTVLKYVHKYNFVRKHWPLFAKIITICITMMLNYGMYRWVIF
jgi:putative flippase GtrA